MDGLGAFGRSDGIDAFGAGQGGQPGPGAHRCLRRQPGCADVVARAGHHQRVSVGPLVGVEGTGRQMIRNPPGSEHLHFHRPLFGQAGRNADIQHSQPPGPLRAGKAKQPGLGIAQGQRRIEVGAGRVNLAGVGVQASGQVQGQQRGRFGELAGPLQQQHRVAGRAGQRPGAAGSQHGVNDHLRAAHQALQRLVIRVGCDFDAILPRQVLLGVAFGAARQQAAGDLGAPASQVSGRHETVGSVVARPHQHDDAGTRRAAQFVARRPRHRQPSVLHQCIGADAGPLRRLLDGGHLRGGYYFHVAGQAPLLEGSPKPASATSGVMVTL